MRSLFLLLSISAMLPAAFISPALGLMLWEWVALNAPHSLAYGYGARIPLNLIVAASALIGLLISNERKLPEWNWTTGLLFSFFVWATLSTLQSEVPAISWVIWDRLSKGLLLALLLTVVLNSKIRVHAAIWIAAISLGAYGFRGGLYWLLSGGSFHFVGPNNTMIHDNNALAMALVMTIPLLLYLRRNSDVALVRLSVTLVAGATFLAVIGTYSRGGLVALVAMLAYLWTGSRKKLRTLIVVMALFVPVFLIAPDNWLTRMDTITNATEDSSFQARLDSWKIYFEVAKDHPILGIGFWSTQQPEVYYQYGSEDAKRALAAHSIYFQVMADLGFVGLGIFLSLGLISWINLTAVIRVSKNAPGLGWASDLANMLRCSLVAYFVGGGALSMSYYDFFYVIVALSIALRSVVDRQSLQGLGSE